MKHLQKLKNMDLKLKSKMLCGQTESTKEIKNWSRCSKTKVSNSAKEHLSIDR